MVRADESIERARRSRSSSEGEGAVSSSLAESSPPASEGEEEERLVAAAAAAFGELGWEGAGEERPGEPFAAAGALASARSSASVPSLRCVLRSSPNAHLATTSIVIAPSAFQTSIATPSVAARWILAHSTSAPRAISSTNPESDAELKTLSQIDFSSRCASGSVAPTTNSPFPATRPNFL